jgi:tRNA U34 2-thiouridine synthase MnmA/TrmU
VALLLSGGVDSSLALRLVQAAGHHVTAFYLQIWFQEDYANFWDACPWEADLAVCQQVLGSPCTVLAIREACLLAACQGRQCLLQASNSDAMLQC